MSATGSWGPRTFLFGKRGTVRMGIRQINSAGRRQLATAGPLQGWPSGSLPIAAGRSHGRMHWT